MNQKAKSESGVFLFMERFGVIAASSSAIAALSDIFSPIGGWYLSAGLFAISTLLVLLIWLKKEWVINLIAKREFSRNILADLLPYQGSCHNSPLFWYAVIGVVVFGYTTYATNAHAEEGGKLAAKFDQVSAFQSTMGIMKSVQADVGQIRQDTSEIKEGMKGLDKETSTNPQKELSKRGYDWDPIRFLHAALAGDLEAVHLYRIAGMKSIGVGGPTMQCKLFLPMLLLTYAGPREMRSGVWDEVSTAIGNETLNEDCERNIVVDQNGIPNGLMGLTPEHKAAFKNSVQHYQHVPGKYSFTGVSLLMLATWMNDAEMVQLFLSHGAKVDNGMQVFDTHNQMKADDVKITPLAEANRLGLKNIADILQKAGGKDVH